MNVNLFAWIREGVKRSVLLGVSDAVETLGSPDEGSDLRQNLLAALRSDQSDNAVHVADNPPRKRLGRSLKDLAE
jgi:hypothetical protein